MREDAGERILEIGMREDAGERDDKGCWR